MTDMRPPNCARRLEAEGQSHPANGCRGCGQLILLEGHPCPFEGDSPQDQDAAQDQAADGATTTTTVRPPVPGTSTGPLYGAAPSNAADFEVNRQPGPRPLTRNQEALLTVMRHKMIADGQQAPSSGSGSIQRAPIGSIAAAAQFLIDQIVVDVEQGEGLLIRTMAPHVGPDVIPALEALAALDD